MPPCGVYLVLYLQAVGAGSKATGGGGMAGNLDTNLLGGEGQGQGGAGVANGAPPPPPRSLSDLAPRSRRHPR